MLLITPWWCGTVKSDTFTSLFGLVFTRLFSFYSSRCYAFSVLWLAATVTLDGTIGISWMVLSYLYFYFSNPLYTL